VTALNVRTEPLADPVTLQHGRIPPEHDIGASLITGNRHVRVSWGRRHPHLWWWELVMDPSSGKVTERLTQLTRPRQRNHPLPPFPVIGGREAAFVVPEFSALLVERLLVPLPAAATEVVQGESFDWMGAQWEGSGIVLMSTPGNGSGDVSVARVERDGRGKRLTSAPAAWELRLSTSSSITTGGARPSPRAFKLTRTGASRLPSVQMSLPGDALVGFPLWSGDRVLLPTLRGDGHLWLVPVRCDGSPTAP
jgi:hypothetical protein